MPPVCDTLPRRHVCADCLCDAFCAPSGVLTTYLTSFSLPCLAYLTCTHLLWSSEHVPEHTVLPDMPAVLGLTKRTLCAPYVHTQRGVGSLQHLQNLQTLVISTQLAEFIHLSICDTYYVSVMAGETTLPCSHGHDYTSGDAVPTADLHAD